MSAVTHRYFVGDIVDQDCRLAKVVAGALARIGEVRTRRRDLADRVGCQLTFNRGEYLIGFCFPEGQQLPPGLRKRESTIHDGQPFTVAVPDKRSKIGAGLANRIRAINTDSFSPSEAICREIEVFDCRLGRDPTSRTGMSMFVSVCGVYGEKVVFKIPFGGEERHNAAQITIPDDLREIPESEFIAIAKEGRQ